MKDLVDIIAQIICFKHLTGQLAAGACAGIKVKCDKHMENIRVERSKNMTVSKYVDSWPKGDSASNSMATQKTHTPTAQRSGEPLKL